MHLLLVPFLVLLNMLVERYVDFVCVFYVVVVLLLLSLSYSPHISQPTPTSKQPTKTGRLRRVRLQPLHGRK